MTQDPIDAPIRPSAPPDRTALRRWSWVLLGAGVLLVAVDLFGYFLGYVVAFVAPFPIIGGIVVAVLARGAVARVAAVCAALLSLTAGAYSSCFLLAGSMPVG